jgi:hypothetical protein
MTHNTTTLLYPGRPKSSSIIDKKGRAKITLHDVGQRKLRHPISKSNTKHKYQRNSVDSTHKGRGEIAANVSLLYPIFEHLLGGIYSASDVEDFFSRTIKVHNDLVRTTGVLQATKTWKAIGNQCHLVLEGRPEQHPGFSVGLTDKWPTKLTHLRPLLFRIVNPNKYNLSTAQTVELRRLVTTLLKVNRVCYDYFDLDTSSLSQKFLVSSSIEKKFTEFLQSRCRTLNDLDHLRCLPFQSPASGPNCTLKVDSAMAEAFALQKSSMWKHILDYCAITDNTGLIEYIEFLSNTYQEDPEMVERFKDPVLRKLIAIPDKGNKSRTIAICDYFTQSLLAQLEKSVVDETQLEFGDHTAFSSHSKGLERIRDLNESVQKQLVSLDATDWTDNLPNRLQYLYLRHKYGPTLAKAWRGIAVDCDWRIGNTKQTVRYGRGQGMGTKGSFAIAHATNIAFIDMILSNQYGDGTTHNNFYLTVGDDMVIQDPEHALMGAFKEIGVPINLTKSKLNTKFGSFVEFVSRNLVNGSDYSLISPTLAARARRQNFYYPILAQHIRERVAVNFRLRTLLDLTNLEVKEKEKILFLSSLFDLSVGSQDKDFTEFIENTDCDTKFQGSLISIIRNLYILMARDFKDFVESTKYREKLINNERANLLQSRFELSYDPDIWNHATRLKLTLEQVELLTLTARISAVREQKYTKGLTVNLKEILQAEVTPRSTLICDIAKFTELALSQYQGLTSTKMRLSTLSSKIVGGETHHRANVQLFSFLNKAFAGGKDLVFTEDLKPYMEALQNFDVYQVLDELNSSGFKVTLRDIADSVIDT